MQQRLKAPRTEPREWNKIEKKREAIKAKAKPCTHAEPRVLAQQIADIDLFYRSRVRRNERRRAIEKKV